jgi:hypothetical protein
MQLALTGMRGSAAGVGEGDMNKGSGGSLRPGTITSAGSAGGEITGESERVTYMSASVVEY